MATQDTYSERANVPAQTPPERHIVQSGLDLLGNWRAGAAATAIVMAALLPFAVAWHVTCLVAIAVSLAGAATLAVGCHVARERRLTTLAIFAEFAHLPELASNRKRLLSVRNRRALARGLRRTAAPTQPPRRFDCCPVLPDRVAPVRRELLEIADTLQRTRDPDPQCVALIRELLTNGCSPLYNANTPTADLHNTLTRVRAGLAAQPHA
jgi:hypothetical protein